MGKGQASGFVKGLEAGFKYLKCCCVLVLGLLCVAFGGTPRSGRQEFLGGKAPLYFGELLIIAGADWKQSRATMPGGGCRHAWALCLDSQTPDPRVPGGSVSVFGAR